MCLPEFPGCELRVEFRPSTLDNPGRDFFRERLRLPQNRRKVLTMRIERVVVQSSSRYGGPLHWCLYLAAVLALAALAHPAFAASRTITEADNGKSIQLNLQDTLTVRLKSNETTGYAWSVLPSSTTCLKLQSQNDVVPPNSAPGAGGKHVFIFQAVSAGKGVLTLHYVRSWEKPDPNETRFTVNVTIE